LNPNTETINPASLKLVQLDSIAESKTNPRKTFDMAKLHELADSIREKGLIQPILLRPIDGLQPYEIVAGARRFRASRLAGKEEIVAIVSELDDRQVLEIHLIENAQREDVPALEEAEGYQQLIDVHGHTLATLAKKTGKTEHHIAMRVKLLDLSANARQALSDGRIHIGHANLLARLSIDNQERLMNFLLPSWDKDCATKQTITQLNNHIEATVYRSLKDAPFKISEKYLVAGVPACTDCPKNSAAQKALFAELAGHAVCTDRACFDSKVDQHVQIELQKATAEDGKSNLVVISSAHYGDSGLRALPNTTYKVAETRDPEAVKALMVDGPDKGRYIRVTVLPEAQDWQEKVEAAATKPKEAATPKKSWAEQQKEEEEKRAKTQKLRRRMRAILTTGIQMYEPKVLTIERLRLLIEPERHTTAEARNIFEELVGAEHGQFAKGIPNSYFNDLQSIDEYAWATAALKLANDIEASLYAPTDLTDIQQGYADLLNIDIPALKKQAKDELKAEAKEQQTPKPTKGKKAKKAAAAEPETEPGEEPAAETPAKKRGRKPKAS